ncbi:hypothetical protein DUNSADRAFT_14415 [Dunaliella salina]|uniref:Encoded protein n=1 Tax=Dunaliella salina TaxID=3046 RepID=A0ABQ7H9H3_DUNSA|nr:hypothetical protein DUNSADRAFT_14415 [Dunaliella salina]|eukprot:KAF5843499.1 hypothetical protein DUNSADRAFT_14415 [Dunaliella salina]
MEQRRQREATESQMMDTIKKDAEIRRALQESHDECTDIRKRLQCEAQEEEDCTERLQQSQQRGKAAGRLGSAAAPGVAAVPSTKRASDNGGRAAACLDPAASPEGTAGSCIEPAEACTVTATPSQEHGGPATGNAPFAGTCSSDSTAAAGWRAYQSVVAARAATRCNIAAAGGGLPAASRASVQCTGELAAGCSTSAAAGSSGGRSGGAAASAAVGSKHKGHQRRIAQVYIAAFSAAGGAAPAH